MDKNVLIFLGVDLTCLWKLDEAVRPGRKLRNDEHLITG